MPPTPTKISDRTCIAVLLLYLCLIYPPWILSNLVTDISFIKGDCYYYRAVIISLLQDGDLLLGNNVQIDLLNGQLALGIHGLVPKHPILLSLVSLPFYQVFGNRGLLIFNVLDCALLLVLVFKLNRLFFNEIVSLITSMLYSTATLFFNYAYNYSPDVFSTVLVLAGLNLVLRNRYYLGALALGLSVFAKLPNLPLAGIILAYAAVRILRGHELSPLPPPNLLKRCGKIAAIGALFLIALAPFGITNQMLFGSPIVTGYQRTAVRGEALGEIAIDDHVDKFNQPFLEGAFRLLFDPDSGLVTTNPVLLVAFLGFIRMNRRANPGPLYLVIAVCIAQFLMFAKYDDWQTSEFSNRFLMTFVAGSSVLTAGYLQFLSGKFIGNGREQRREAV